MMEEPGGWLFAVVVTVGAGDESQAVGGDDVELGFRKPGAGLSRGLVEESVHEPESVGIEYPGQLSQVLRFVLNAMKAADVQYEIECPFDVIHFCCIVCKDFGLNACFADFFLCDVDGENCEIKTNDLPACFCDGDDVGAGSAANIQCAAGWMVFEEGIKFGWGDAGIPWGSAKVGSIEF